MPGWVAGGPRERLERRRPVLSRRPLLTGLLAGTVAAALRPARAQRRRFRVAFANLNETPGVTLEGLDFKGTEVRRSFELAARTLPLDMLFYDNAGDPERSVANAEAAVTARVDLLIEYNNDAEANAAISQRLAAAGIPVLAVVHPVPGAPWYGPDDHAAGLIAGKALGAFARENWADEDVLGVLIGDQADPSPAVSARIQGITDGVQETLPGLKLASLDTGGQPVRADALLTKFLLAQRGGRMLIATLDDIAAIYARTAIELNRRQSDCIIVSQGLDANIHGGVSEKKDLDPSNRGSVVLGSVAYYMDRYGYDVLPLAMQLLNGETIPPRTFTRHLLVTAANVFREYPPYDMN